MDNTEERIVKFFTEERPWLLTQRHSFNIMINMNGASFDRLVEETGVSLDTIEQIWNNLRTTAQHNG